MRVSLAGTLVNSQQEVFLPQSQIPASTPFLEQIFGNFTGEPHFSLLCIKNANLVNIWFS